MRPRRRSQVLRLSPTSVSIFRQCRYHYKARYIDKLGEQYARARPHLTMANHVHATLRDFLSLKPPAARTIEAIEDLLRGHWRLSRLGFKDEKEERQWAQRALTQLRTFASSYQAGARPLMVEAAVDIELSPGLVLYTRVDRVDKETDGSLHIIDYKTGAKPPEKDWTQLHLQALVVSRKLTSPVSRVSLLYLDPWVMDSARLSKEVLDGAYWELLRTARDIRGEKLYPPATGAWCVHCDFTAICPAEAPPEAHAQALAQMELFPGPGED
jgi:CRISPR/Cas system-associated exonuclease Cas4 (RecB family)